MQGKVRMMYRVKIMTALEIPERRKLIQMLEGLELTVDGRRLVLLEMIKERLRVTRLQTATWLDVPWYRCGKSGMTMVLGVVNCDIIPDHAVKKDPESSVAWLRSRGQGVEREARYVDGVFSFTTSSGRTFAWRMTERRESQLFGNLQVNFGDGSVELASTIMAYLGLPEELLAPASSLRR